MLGAPCAVRSLRFSSRSCSRSLCSPCCRAAHRRRLRSRSPKPPFAPPQALPFLSENGLYPVQVRLLSKEEPVATLRTPMVFLSDVPQTPLHLAWTWVLARPMQTGPDGVFEPGTLESDIAPGGPV